MEISMIYFMIEAQNDWCYNRSICYTEPERDFLSGLFHMMDLRHF